MKKLFFLNLLFIFTINATGADQATGSYDVEEEGFYLKHFDRSPDSDENCQTFNGLLLRGGQPDLKSNTWLEKIKDNDVSLVVDLRNDSDNSSEKNSLLKSGISYIKLPLTTFASNQARNLKVEEASPCFENNCTPTTTITEFYRTKASIYVLKKIRAAFANNKKVYLHCKRGQDRTGLIAGLLRHCSNWETEFKNYKGYLYPALKSHLKEIKSDEEYEAIFE